METHSLWVGPLMASLVACASPQQRTTAAPLASGLCVNHNHEADCAPATEKNDSVGRGEGAVQSAKARPAKATKTSSRTVTLTSGPGPMRPPPMGRPPSTRPPPR